MTQLPTVKWTPLFIPNPDRRWWQFWKPKTIVNSEALLPIFTETNELLDGIPIRKVEKLN